jgi:hypothetical protein
MCIHSHSICTKEHTALYNYTHPHWKPLHQLCSWSGYWPELNLTELLLQAQAKLSLHLVKPHDMTSYGEVEVGVWICVFLTSELDENEWLASRSGRLPSSHSSNRGLCGPGIRSGRFKERNISCPCGEWNHDSLDFQSVTWSRPASRRQKGNILRAHYYGALQYKIQLPGQPGGWDLCTADVVGVHTYTHTRARARTLTLARTRAHAPHSRTHTHIHTHTYKHTQTHTHSHILIHTHIYTRTHTHTHTLTYTHTLTHTHIHTHSPIHTQTNTQTHTYSHSHTHARAHTHSHTHTHTHTHTLTLTHLHTHTHPHTHTHTLTCTHTHTHSHTHPLTHTHTN